MKSWYLVQQGETHKIPVGKPVDHTGNMDLGGRIILKWILNT
jgi:hypothetical protein